MEFSVQIQICSYAFCILPYKFNGMKFWSGAFLKLFPSSLLIWPSWAKLFHSTPCEEMLCFSQCSLSSPYCLVQFHLPSIFIITLFFFSGFSCLGILQLSSQPIRIVLQCQSSQCQLMTQNTLLPPAQLDQGLLIELLCK